MERPLREVRVARIPAALGEFGGQCDVPQEVGCEVGAVPQVAVGVPVADAGKGAGDEQWHDQQDKQKSAGVPSFPRRQRDEWLGPAPREPAGRREDSPGGDDPGAPGEAELEGHPDRQRRQRIAAQAAGDPASRVPTAEQLESQGEPGYECDRIDHQVDESRGAGKLPGQDRHDEAQD